MNRQIAIIGGGTVFHVRNHLGLCATAYGKTPRRLFELCQEMIPDMDPVLFLTKMAGGHAMETNDDVDKCVDRIIVDPNYRIIFMPVALCDYTGSIGEKAGKYAERLQTRTMPRAVMNLQAAPKIISKIRRERKDIFLVGFKTTCGASADDQYLAGLNLCKTSSCNLVLANDTMTHLNMVITPEEARYHETDDRDEALRGLVEMTYLRSHLNFTRSTVVAGERVPWNDAQVPNALRAVVDFCIDHSAYKPFNGATVGHFACKVDEKTFLTSIRKTDFNRLSETGLVKIVTDGPDSVIAYGARPSVGGQSQRIVFQDHQDVDCIVHFHCPLLPGSAVPVVSQREFECGSHECGQNTSRGLTKFGNLYAVYLDNHGPNVVFHRSIDPQEVINFIQENFDLSQKTGGYVSIPEPVPEMVDARFQLVR
jgi:ribulose-5-phosphate 4-epimerase/fuculose-1-phosphate aldolase